ncbi:hypothetical protein Psta_0267 [Pirellula staleyi DSM 6068]|uniref:Uncharacterized protein n=1 Tax=Pirellula staleyi (strain ATCC 27377 / DSM 6068 / ICPB 4128) TaxID=530564 RepID=D2R1H7_PIRSD|nr:hypothetical protein Psta_0267 [Pirellula staleyi DSM 6068]
MLPQHRLAQPEPLIEAQPIATEAVPVSSATKSRERMAAGSVGQDSGTTSFVSLVPAGHRRQMAIVRVTESTLRDNCFTIGIIIVNAIPVAVGILADPQDILQHEVNDGDQLVVVVDAVPLLNGISCDQLGRLAYELRLVEFESVSLGRISTCDNRRTDARDWFAWSRRSRPGPRVFQLAGKSQVSHLGIEVLFLSRLQERAKPRVLLIDLILIERPGSLAQAMHRQQSREESPQISGERTQVNLSLTLVIDKVAGNIVN